jgi:type II secretory pathway pseudopilin PulG
LPIHYYFRDVAVVVAVALCVALFFAWRADVRDRAQLAAELASTRQLLVAADARQHDRDAQLAQTLAALAAQKRNSITPAQIVKDLPNTLPLPAPITLLPAPPATNKAPTVTPTQAVIPAQDLKPLYDFSIDCKACQAKLSAAQNDLVDERTKTVALTKERDDALRIAKGGSPWRRVARAAKWFALGAAAGALAAKTAH